MTINGGAGLVVELEQQTVNDFTPSRALCGRDEDNDLELEDIIQSYLDECRWAVTEILEQGGIQAYYKWLTYQDRDKVFEIEEPCKCFFHEYLGDLGAYFVIGYEEISVVNPFDKTNRCLTQIVPYWFTRFQMLMRNEFGASASVADAIEVIDNFMEQYY